MYSAAEEAIDGTAREGFWQRGPDPRAEPARAGRRPDLLRSWRKPPGRARRALRRSRPDQAGRLQARERRIEHGRRLREVDGPTRHRAGDTGTGSMQRVHRDSHSLPGLDATAAPRRPGAARIRGSRSVPGDRLPAHVRADGEVGGADRRPAPRPRVRTPRLPDGDVRQAGSRGPGATRGHAQRERGGAGGAALPARGGRAAPAATRAPFDAARRGAAADRHCRRRRLDKRRVHGPAPLRGSVAASGRVCVPVPGPLRQRSPALCRRRRDRRQSRARAAHPGGRRCAGPRRPAGGDHHQRVHAFRGSHAEADAGACACRRRRAGSGLRGRPAHQRGNAGARRRARRAAPAGEAGLDGRSGCRPSRLRGLEYARAGARAAAAGGDRPSPARTATPRRDRRERRGQLTFLAASLLSLPTLVVAALSYQRCNVLASAGGGRGEVRPSGPARRRVLRRRRFPHERPGAGDGGAAPAPGDHPGREQRLLRNHPDAPGAELSRARPRDTAREPRLRRVCALVRRLRRARPGHRAVRACLRARACVRNVRPAGAAAFGGSDHAGHDAVRDPGAKSKRPGRLMAAGPDARLGGQSLAAAVTAVTAAAVTAAAVTAAAVITAAVTAAAVVTAAVTAAPVVTAAAVATAATTLIVFAMVVLPVLAVPAPALLALRTDLVVGAPVAAAATVVAVALGTTAGRAIGDAGIALAMIARAAARAVAVIADLVVAAAVAAGAAVIAVVIRVAARARVRNAGVALAVVARLAAHVVAALADLIVRALAPASAAVVAVVVGHAARRGVRDTAVVLAVRPGAAAHVVAALADLVVRALASAGAAVVAIAAGVAAGAAVRDAGVPLPVVAGSAADAMPVIADFVLAAAI